MDVLVGCIAINTYYFQYIILSCNVCNREYLQNVPPKANALKCYLQITLQESSTNTWGSLFEGGGNPLPSSPSALSQLMECM